MPRFALFAFVICFALAGCNAFFATGHPQAPLMRGKNDLQTVANGGFSGINASASYSPLNHLYVGGTLHIYPSQFDHVSGGPHIGYYHNSPDSTFQFNTMAGYTWGYANYANPFTGGDVSGEARYQSLHWQILVAHQGGKRGNNFWGIVVFADPARLKYSVSYHYNSPDSLATDVVSTGISFYFQHRLRAAPALRITWQFGYQTTMSETLNPDDVANPMILRLGLVYQFRPSIKRKKQQ